MKRSRFTDEQIAYALRQVDGGTAVADVCRQMGISEATFYVWKKKYANLGSTEIRELRQLRDENAKLKRLVADLPLDKHILTEIVRKKICGRHGSATSSSGCRPPSGRASRERVGWCGSRVRYRRIEVAGRARRGCACGCASSPRRALVTVTGAFTSCSVVTVGRT